jgi:hypothetical protein
MAGQNIGDDGVRRRGGTADARVEDEVEVSTGMPHRIGLARIGQESK